MKKKFFTKKKIIFLVIMILIVGFVLYSCSKAKELVQYEKVNVERRDILTYLEFSGNIEPVDSSKIYAKTSGNIEEVMVKEGDEIKKGDVIAKIDASDVEYNIALQEKNLELTKLQNEYSLKDAKTSLNNINTQISEGKNATLNNATDMVKKAGDSHDKLAQTYIDAVKEYNKAKSEYDKNQVDSVLEAEYQLSVAKKNAEKLFNTNSDDYNDYIHSATMSLSSAKKTAKKNLESLEEAMETAKENYDSAVESYENSVRDLGTTQLSVEQNIQSYKDLIAKTSALSNTEASEMQIEHLKESLDKYLITSDISGFVTSLNIAQGDSVGLSSTPVAEVMNLNTMQVKIKIDEYDLAQVSVGEDVDIYISALDAHYEGKLAKLARIATATNGVSYVDATVEFKADDRIISGLSADVKLVKIDEKQALSLPADAISYDVDNTSYVLQYNDKKEEVKTYVTIGVSDGDYVQILDGLSEGAEVLVTPKVENMMKMMVSE